MKELSIEQKAQRYDEAIEKAKEFKNNPFAGYDGTDLISSLFPELKESEDDDIRKKLISFFQRFPYENLENAGLSAKDAITWLEKQGEQKPAWSEEDEKMWSQVINEIEAIKSNSSTVFEKNIAQDKIDFLKALKERYTWKPSDEQMEQLKKYCPDNRPLTSLYKQLKKLKG